MKKIKYTKEEALNIYKRLSRMAYVSMYVDFVKQNKRRAVDKVELFSFYRNMLEAYNIKPINTTKKQ